MKKVVHFYEAPVTPVCSNIPTEGTRSMQIVTRAEMQLFLPLNLHGNKAISSTQSAGLPHGLHTQRLFHFPSAFLCSI